MVHFTLVHLTMVHFAVVHFTVVHLAVVHLTVVHLAVVHGPVVVRHAVHCMERVVVQWNASQSGDIVKVELQQMRGARTVYWGLSSKCPLW